MNMKNCGCRNVRKHIKIKVSDKYVALEISLKFGSLYNMKIAYSESKYNLGISVKGLITSLGLKAKARPKKYKKARYAIISVSKKYISKIIRGFEKLSYKSYERNRTKHEPTDSYFYLAIQLAKCMMRSDTLNLHVYPVRTDMTATKYIPNSHVCSTGESKLKEFLFDKTLSQICYTDEDESKGTIFDKCSTEED